MKFNRFSSYEERDGVLDCVVEGVIPKWISGSFIANGPGQYKVGDQSFQHWFDGFALLKGFRFDDGNVSAVARYIRSKQFLESNQRQELYINEFGTSAKGFMGGLRDLLCSSQYDNANVNLYKIDSGDVVAVTETPHHWIIDKDTLATIQKKTYQDDIKAQICLPHPILDYNRKVLVNIMVRYGRKTSYQVIQHCMETGHRKKIACYDSDVPFYLNSFLMTPRYVILYRTSTELNVTRLLNPAKPILNAFVNQSTSASSFIVIDRKDGSAREFSVDGFHCYHGCNAYECGDDLILDIITTSSGDYSGFTIENISSSLHVRSNLVRYVISLKNGTVKHEKILSGGCVEFPRINERLDSGNAYKHLYVVDKAEDATWFNQIKEVGVQSGSVRQWSQDNVVVGEPVFIECSHEIKDSVIMSLISDEVVGKSGLVIISAETFERVAVIWLPCYFAPGLHGNFFS